MSNWIMNISPRRLHTLRRQDREVDVFDVRTPAEYRAGHASGAKLIPLDELEPETLAAQAQHAGAGSDEPVYLIGRNGSHPRPAAERMIEAGYRNVALVEGGTEAWERAGLPMQRCENAISQE